MVGCNVNTLTVTATIFVPDSCDTSEISGSATAIIDSVADNPTAKFDGEVADGGEGCSPEGGVGASDTEIENFLGLASGALEEAAGEGSFHGAAPTFGSATKRTLELQDGDHVELTHNFLQPARDDG